MLDKSVPYFDVIMVLPEDAPLPQVPDLPRGYAYHLYCPGDEAAWCRIETSVGEFDSEPQAMDYFQREFMPFPQWLPRRMAFIRDAKGGVVACAAAWWRRDAKRGEVALLHWVAVKPSHQGLGLGRAVTAKALSLFPGERQDIWLTTQTFSHVAIGLYVSMGFRAHKDAAIAGHKNGFHGAVPVLERVMQPKVFARMMLMALEG